MANVHSGIIQREFQLIQLALAGVKIVVVPPFQYKVKRTWKERLFSLPWKPFVTDTIEHSEVLRDGEVIQYDNQYVLYCNAATKKMIEEAINVQYITNI